MKIGNDDMTLKVGSTDVSAVYLGSTLVYEEESPFLVKWLATYDDSSTTSAECDSSSAITQYEITGAFVSLEVGDCVTSIGDYAFKFCSSLISIDIPDSVTTIGSGAFQNCYNLTSINIPSSVTTIGIYAFRNCSGLTSVTIGSGVTTIDNNTFYFCTSLTSIDIPSSVTTIGSGAFSDCTNLEYVNIPSGVTSIGSYTFYNCYSLSSIVIPSGVRSIGREAFRNCSGLTSIDIPDTVTSISSSAFQGCSGLTSIEIQSGITSIGGDAFRNCSSLTSITINATTPPTLGSSVFTNTNNCPIYVPSSSVETYKSASGWSTYADRIQAIPSPTPTSYTWVYADENFVNAQQIYGVRIFWLTEDDNTEAFDIYGDSSFTESYYCQIDFDGVEYAISIYDGSGNTIYSDTVLSMPTELDFITIFGKPMYLSTAPYDYGMCINEQCVATQCNCEEECMEWDEETGECLYSQCPPECEDCMEWECYEREIVYITDVKIITT